MNIILPPELEQFVSRKVASGLYPSASEVVREGLELLKQLDADDHAKLRASIAIGMEQADRGDCIDGESVFQMLNERKASPRTAVRGLGQNR